MEASFSPDNTNFLFTVRDETGATLLTNYTGQNYGAIQTYQFNATSYEQNGSSASYTPMTIEEYEEVADKTYDVTCYVKDPITAQDRYYSPYTTSEALYASRYLIVAATVISALLALVVFIFLMCSAGRKKDRDEIVLSGLNKLPLDLYAAVAVLIAVPLTNVAFSYGGFMHSVWWALGITAVLTMLGLLVLSVCMSFAARVKRAGGGKTRSSIVSCGLFVARCVRCLTVSGKYSETCRFCGKRSFCLSPTCLST